MTPSYLKVTIGGSETPDFLILLDSDVTHELNRHPSCSVRFRQPPGSTYDYYGFFGKDLVVTAVDAEGASLELFNGILSQVDCDWQLDGSCEFDFIGIGSSYLLDTKNNSQTFNELELDAVVQRLTHGTMGDFGAFDPGEISLIQYDETDWSYLLRIADRYGCFVKVKDQKINFINTFQDGVDMPWRTENGLQVFRTTGKITPNELYGVNFGPGDATSKEWPAVDNDLDSESSLSELRAGAWAGAKRNKLQSAVWNKFLAPGHNSYEKQLKMECDRQNMQQCTVYGESRIPEVETSKKINITGTHDFAGNYNVYKIVHRWLPYGGGYRNKFWCTPYQKYFDAVRPAVQRNFGPAIARVTATAVPDEKWTNIKVKFLWEKDNETGWLPIVTPNAGQDRGICFIPEIGDEVLVYFRDGDASKPMIIGSMWNGVDTPPLDDLHGGEYPTNDLKRIVTKSGNRLVMDDKVGSETVVLAGPKHVRVSLFDGGSTMLLHSDGDIHINAGGTVHMRCKQFLREVGDGPVIDTSVGGA